VAPESSSSKPSSKDQAYFPIDYSEYNSLLKTVTNSFEMKGKKLSLEIKNIIYL
jgi:hypothetical protein